MIREITIQDAQNYLDMLYQLDVETNNMMFEPGERTTTLQNMEDRINNNQNNLLLVAEDENNHQIVGFLACDRGFANRIKHRAYIVIGILKDYRNQQIGSKLFERLDQWAKENKLIRLELTVMAHNGSAIRLYEKMGFKKEGLKEKSMLVGGQFVDEYYMAKIYSYEQ